MGIRRIGLIVVLALLASPAVPVRADAGDWCAAPAAAPCIVSATRDGVGVTSADASFDLYVVDSSGGGSSSFLWGVQSKTNPDPYELGAGERSFTWSITFDTGTLVPRVAFARGDNMVVTRVDDGDGTYQITIEATPVLVSGQCNQDTWPWVCPETADDVDERQGYLGGEVTDYGSWDDATQREAMWGLNYATNIAAVSLPPEIAFDDATGTEYLLLRMANPHFLSTGDPDVFLGDASLRIPNAFLKQVYGIDAPATMTSGGLSPALSGGGGGTISTSQEAGDTAMLVEVDDVTFSARVLRVKRGTITPTKPRDVRTRRITARKGTVRFDRARPRGSRITGYRVGCVARRGTHVRTVVGADSPVVVTRLRRGVPYDCRVQARSRAGAGPWSAKVGLRAKPA